jgi:diaminopimelate epimerase
MQFKKMHGNGNDFIIIENLTQTISLTKSQIIKMGDIKKGLGFDQLITINPPKKIIMTCT